VYRSVSDLFLRLKKGQNLIMNELTADKSKPQPAEGAPLNQNQSRTEATRARILKAAHQQFVANGLEGTRMEAVAQEAGVNKALVYRHFVSRENLYREVLGRSYEQVRSAEAELVLPDDPQEAIDTLVSFTLHYYIANPDFLVLVGIENLNRGAHLREVSADQLRTTNLVKMIEEVIACGVERGVFRTGLDPADLYMVLSSQCWFTVATQFTFGFTFKMDVLSADNIAKREKLICDNVRRWVLPD
jgi:AcrR family transcriptional regulator